MKKGLLALLCASVVLAVPACGKKDHKDKAHGHKDKMHKEGKKHKKHGKDHAHKGMDKAKTMGY